ncbi:MAG: alanine racemase [Chitinispirillaceae bacterium]|nr:alanine racemase [Chitinispirillaceae bacterium]
MTRDAFLPRIDCSLDDLLHNCSVIRSRLPPGVELIAVVKDRAYGCGSRSIALALERYGGVRFFAVNNPSEAFFLRRHGIKSPLLVLGPAAPPEIRKGSHCGLIFTLNDLSDLESWKKTGVPVRFHCNVDTRMHRMGILPRAVPEAACRIARSPLLLLEGVFTHLANADVGDMPVMRAQVRLLNAAVARFRKEGIDPAQIHFANSAGITHFPLRGCTLVRPGIELYGCRPNPSFPVPLDLKPVLTLKSQVVNMKAVPAGTPISYGGRYITRRDTVIATIGLGYGCGYPRSLGNRGYLLIRGKRYRIAGAVTMDFCMVDAGPSPGFKVRDEVVAIGRQGKETITPDDIALLDHTIAYEILCRLGPFPEKTYFLNGRVFAREKGYIY